MAFSVSGLALETRENVAPPFFETLTAVSSSRFPARASSAAAVT